MLGSFRTAEEIKAGYEEACNAQRALVKAEQLPLHPDRDPYREKDATPIKKRRTQGGCTSRFLT